MLRFRSVARRWAAVLAVAGQALVLGTASVSAQSEAGRKAGPARPAPRRPDGTINLGASLGETGVWEGRFSCSPGSACMDSALSRRWTMKLLVDPAVKHTR